MQIETILDVPITVEDRQSIETAVTQALQEKKQLLITTPNPEIIVYAQSHPYYLQVLQQADIALPDGMGIVIGLRMQGVSIPRITGRDFFLWLLEEANRLHLSIYLVGASPESNSRSLQKIAREYPDVICHGSAELQVDNHGKGNDQEAVLLEEIKKIQPMIICVALGHPKQELWLARIRHQVPHSVGITLGGTLDYFSGAVSIPPAFVKTMGLEWLYRLIHQPHRIGRIVQATVIFPLLYLRRRLKD